MTSYWRKVDGRLIRRGEIILDLKFVRRYANELREMNDGKKGMPFKITNSFILFLAIFRYVFSVRFR
ncbi:MAG: hypothetical protein QXO17_00335 [Nitrososphaerota archaeon]